MATIEIEGKKYKVIETLPYHGAGKPAKIVEDKTSETGERMVVKQGGKWRFWTAQDRLGLGYRLAPQRFQQTLKGGK